MAFTTFATPIEKLARLNWSSPSLNRSPAVRVSMLPTGIQAHRVRSHGICAADPVRRGSNMRNTFPGMDVMKALAELHSRSLDTCNDTEGTVCRPVKNQSMYMALGVGDDTFCGTSDPQGASLGLLDPAYEDMPSVGGGTPVTNIKMRAFGISGDAGFSSMGTVVQRPHLILDSGIKLHMVGDPTILSNLRDAPAGLAVTRADGYKLPITQIGVIEAPGFRISEVYLVPGLRCNLISINQLGRSGVVTNIVKEQANLALGQTQVGFAVAEESMYVLRFLDMP